MKRYSTFLFSVIADATKVNFTNVKSAGAKPEFTVKNSENFVY